MTPRFHAGFAAYSKPVDCECDTGKLCWSNQRTAATYANFSRARWRTRVRVYKCLICRWWHVTTAQQSTFGDRTITADRRK